MFRPGCKSSLVNLKAWGKLGLETGTEPTERTEPERNGSNGPTERNDRTIDGRTDDPTVRSSYIHPSMHPPTSLPSSTIATKRINSKVRTEFQTVYLWWSSIFFRLKWKLEARHIVFFLFFLASKAPLPSPMASAMSFDYFRLCYFVLY